MSYEELKACFVGRQPLLDELLDTLREQAGASTLQHWMILGSRGMGKTHLIRLFYREIIEDPDLTKQWLPILMHEEEQVVFNLSTLFTRIIEMLAESLENQGCRDAALSTSAFLDTLRDKAKGQTQLLDRAKAYLKQFSMDQGRRLLVLLENADDLLTKCLPNESDVQKLRKMLSLDNFMLIIGASPTFFPRISQPKGVFYDFFRLRRLELLTFQQALELLQKWAQQEMDEARSAAFSNADYRLKVMYHLTGGNPRLLYFLYKAITNVDSLEDASSTFEAMLEKDLTAYYLSRMRDIPNQVQPIVITLAKSEKNLTQKEIAHQSFLPERSLGTQMLRLEKEDVVKPVSGKKGKNTIYTLTDYLFRIWYQWRYAKQKNLIRGLVEFLAVWFSQRELEQMCGAGGMAGQYYTEALAFKHCDSFKPHLEAILQEGAATLREFAFKGEYIDAASILADIGEYAPDRREAFKKVIRDSGLSDEPENIEKVMQARIEADSGNSEDWFWLGDARFKQKDYSGAENAFQKAVDLKPDDPAAWKWLGRARGVQEDHAGAELAFQKAVDLKQDDPDTWRALGLARGVQEDHAGAELAFQKAVDLKPDDPDTWYLLGLARFSQEDYAGAELALQKTVELKPDEANYRNSYAGSLFRSNRFKEAIEAQHRILKMDRFYAEAYFDLCIFNLLAGSVDTLFATMEKALRTKKAPAGFKTQIQLFFALVLAHDGEKKAFLKNLGSGVRALETIDEKLRRKILSDLSRFLVDAISPLTLESVKTYVDEFQKVTEDTAVLSIIRPLTHVLEYTQACITQKTGYASKQAQKALDRIPGELKGPVEEMANTVRKNLKWQSKVLKRSSGGKAGRYF
jgi:cytochrome c-type biogenesis protein CcmH/NrfG